MKNFQEVVEAILDLLLKARIDERTYERQYTRDISFQYLNNPAVMVPTLFTEKGVEEVFQVPNNALFKFLLEKEGYWQEEGEWIANEIGYYSDLLYHKETVIPILAGHNSLAVAKAVVAEMKRREISINFQGQMGQTILEIFSSCDEATIKYLINEGSDPNLKNRDDVSPLYCIVDNGNELRSLDLIMFLLEKGAEVVDVSENIMMHLNRKNYDLARHLKYFHNEKAIPIMAYLSAHVPELLTNIEVNGESEDEFAFSPVEQKVFDVLVNAFNFIKKLKVLDEVENEEEIIISGNNIIEQLNDLIKFLDTKRITEKRLSEGFPPYREKSLKINQYVIMQIKEVVVMVEQKLQELQFNKFDKIYDEITPTKIESSPQIADNSFTMTTVLQRLQVIANQLGVTNSNNNNFYEHGSENNEDLHHYGPILSTQKVDTFNETNPNKEFKVPDVDSISNKINIHFQVK